MTFNNKVDHAFQLAEPGDYSGTFGLSAPQLEDGSLGIGSNGVVSWSPDADCASGTYAVTVTYNYSGGLQMKALTLTIEAVDLPPAFPFTDYAFSPSPPMPSADWHNDEVIISRQIAGNQYTVDWTYPAWGEGTVAYQLIPGSLGLPSGYTFDTSTGEFTCTVSNADSFMAYDFYAKATDSSGQFDLQHVVIPVTGYYQGQPYLTPYAADACLEYSTADESQGYKEITLYDTESFPAPVGYKELVIDQGPAHGTLSDGAYWTDVKYTPTDGFRGVDSFSYHWVYDAYAAYGYNGQPPALIGRYSTNVGHIQIQVGSWVDLAPDQPYTTDTALVGVGGSTTVTLTLQNPRADGYTDNQETWHRCPSTGYWQLDFSPSQIRVYNAAGVEILPEHHVPRHGDRRGANHSGGGRRFRGPGESFGDLARLGLRRGELCHEPRARLVLLRTAPTTVDVMGLIWVNNNNQPIPGDTATHHIPVQDGQRLILTVAGVPNPATATYSWSTQGLAVNDYTPDNNTQQVWPLEGDLLHNSTVSFAWYAGGDGRKASVEVDGIALNAWLTSATRMYPRRQRRLKRKIRASALRTTRTE